ncbi:MAG: alginate lyase family protein [Cyanobacteriota bacterium]
MFALPGRESAASGHQDQRAAFQAILYRIIDGNSQAAIGTSGVSQDQLKFILEYEEPHSGLEKRWLLNRIADPVVRQELISLLEQYRQNWVEIPFEAGAYSRCWTDIGAVPQELHPWNPRIDQQSKSDQSEVLDYIGRAKSLYLCNHNDACNFALTEGWRDAPWVFPCDAGCFLTRDSWDVIRPLLDLPNLAYIAIPTAFAGDGRVLLRSPDQPPLPDGLPFLGFARQVTPPYDAMRRPTTGSETDLIGRLGLGLAGPWLEEAGHPCGWEGFDSSLRSDRARLVQAGWAYRLGSPPSARLQDRRDAIRTYARKLDMQLIGDALQQQTLRCWAGLSAGEESIPGLSVIAANARSVPPISVADKPEPLPGAPRLSYVNAVPHWQSLAGSESTLNRTGLLGSAAPLCGDVAQYYDRARLQLMIDCVCALALDGQLNGSQASRDHAVKMLRSWFIDPATAMIPDGAYARLSSVDPNRNVLDAAIDFRDFYPLLDAITLLQRSGGFLLSESQQLDEWFDAFLGWLASDSSTFLQHHSANPACTWYHLLMLAIAAYRGRRNVVAQVFDNLPGLLAKQFRADGSPLSCAADASLRHEHLFNLQAWSNIAVLSSALGRDLLAFKDSNGIGIQAAFDHARNHLPATDPQEAPALSPRRWLQAMSTMAHTQYPGDGANPADLPPLAEATSGLPPFWNLCRSLK